LFGIDAEVKKRISQDVDRFFRFIPVVFVEKVFRLKNFDKIDKNGRFDGRRRSANQRNSKAGVLVSNAKRDQVLKYGVSFAGPGSTLQN
jgi:hypothetical protein